MSLGALQVASGCVNAAKIVHFSIGLVLDDKMIQMWWFSMPSEYFVEVVRIPNTQVHGSTHTHTISTSQQFI